MQQMLVTLLGIDALCCWVFGVFCVFGIPFTTSQKKPEIKYILLARLDECLMSAASQTLRLQHLSVRYSSDAKTTAAALRQAA